MDYYPVLGGLRIVRPIVHRGIPQLLCTGRGGRIVVRPFSWYEMRGFPEIVKVSGSWNKDFYEMEDLGLEVGDLPRLLHVYNRRLVHIHNEQGLQIPLDVEGEDVYRLAQLKILISGEWRLFCERTGRPGTKTRRQRSSSECGRSIAG